MEAARSEADKTVKAAEKRLALANAAVEIRAPADGTILKIDRRPGQRLTADAAIQMGDLRTMYVNCQVFQGDILSLRKEPEFLSVYGHLWELLSHQIVLGRGAGPSVGAGAMP